MLQYARSVKSVDFCALEQKSFSRALFAFSWHDFTFCYLPKRSSDLLGKCSFSFDPAQIDNCAFWMRNAVRTHFIDSASFRELLSASFPFRVLYYVERGLLQSKSILDYHPNHRKMVLETQNWFCIDLPFLGIFVVYIACSQRHC